MSNQVITKPDQETSQSVAEFVELGMDIMASYGMDQDVGVLENLDRVYALWQEDPNEKPTGEEVAVGLGAVLGDRICARSDFEWRVVEDQYGTELAIISVSTSMQFYPIDFVRKRAQPGNCESEFFTGIWEILKSKCAAREA